MRMTRVGCGLSLFMAAFVPAIAADAKITDVRFGDVLVGPKIQSDDLKGRVVLIELWGIR